MADETPKEGAAPGATPPKPAPAPAAAAAKKGPVAADASQKPLVAALAAAVPGAVLSAKEFVSETTVDVALDKIVDACRHLKNESFTYLVDLTAVDWKERQPRFDVVYYLHSFLRNNERIRLKVKVKEGEACPSATSVFETSNWMEREVFDLFGIPFAKLKDQAFLNKLLGISAIALVVTRFVPISFSPFAFFWKMSTFGWS